MKNKRIISRIDLNNGQLVKGKLLEGLRKLGDPIPYLKSYYFDKLDEIILLDAVASLYERSSNYDFLKEVCKEFIDYIDIDENKFHNTIDKFRSGHLWDKQNSGWKLKHTVYN